MCAVDAALAKAGIEERYIAENHTAERVMMRVLRLLPAAILNAAIVVECTQQTMTATSRIFKRDQPQTHDDSFVPDAVLRASRGNYSIGGISRLTTLVNGSAPGPELRLTEGTVVWIRVYNDLPLDNFTMVCHVRRWNGNHT